MKKSIILISVTAAFLLASCGAHNATYKRNDGFSQVKTTTSERVVKG